MGGRFTEGAYFEVRAQQEESGAAGMHFFSPTDILMHHTLQCRNVLKEHLVLNPYPR